MWMVIKRQMDIVHLVKMISSASILTGFHVINGAHPYYDGIVTSNFSFMKRPFSIIETEKIF